MIIKELIELLEKFDEEIELKIEFENQNFLIERIGNDSINDEEIVFIKLRKEDND